MKSRTHTCGVLSKESVNQSVILNGWISYLFLDISLENLENVLITGNTLRYSSYQSGFFL